MNAQKVYDKLSVSDIIMYTDEQGDVYYAKVTQIYYALNEIDVYHLNDNEQTTILKREDVKAIYKSI